MATTFTRYTEKDGLIKLFNGRKKVHEFEPTALLIEVTSLADDHLEGALDHDAEPSVGVFLEQVELLDDFDPDADPDAVEYSGNVVPKKYKDKYGKNQNCGDPIAQAITAGVMTMVEYGTKRDGTGKLKKSVNPDSLTEVQEANDIDGQRWAHLNPGMQVMNTSNVLRGKFWRGEAVTVFKLKLDLTKLVKKTKAIGEALRNVEELGFKPNAKQTDTVSTLFETTHEA